MKIEQVKIQGLKPQQIKFLEYYLDINSETFGNAKRSAIKAKYSKSFMKNIKIIVEDKELELSEETSKMVMSELKKDKKEFPQVGDKVWIVEDNGGIDSFRFDNDDIDNKYLNIGNLYKTEKEAELQVKKLKAIVRVKNYIKDNFGYDPEDWADWEDINMEKWSIVYNRKNKVLDTSVWSILKFNSFIGYIKTGDNCKTLIKNCKEDLELICK